MCSIYQHSNSPLRLKLKNVENMDKRASNFGLIFQIVNPSFLGARSEQRGQNRNGRDPGPWIQQKSLVKERTEASIFVFFMKMWLGHASNLGLIFNLSILLSWGPRMRKMVKIEVVVTQGLGFTQSFSSNRCSASKFSTFLIFWLRNNFCYCFRHDSWCWCVFSTLVLEDGRPYFLQTADL